MTQTGAIKILDLRSRTEPLDLRAYHDISKSGYSQQKQEVAAIAIV